MKLTSTVVNAEPKTGQLQGDLTALAEAGIIPRSPTPKEAVKSDR